MSEENKQVSTPNQKQEPLQAEINPKFLLESIKNNRTFLGNQCILRSGAIYEIQRDGSWKRLNSQNES